MFGNNKPKNEAGKSILPTASSNSLNSLVQGTVVEGKLKATNDIRIDGKIKGELHCDAKVIIGPKGVIEGSVECKNAVIEGHFDGTLVVTELLNIRENAKVVGEVSYGKLIVQSGAVISGYYTVIGDKSNGTLNKKHTSSMASAKVDRQNVAGEAQLAGQKN